MYRNSNSILSPCFGSVISSNCLLHSTFLPKVSCTLPPIAPSALNFSAREQTLAFIHFFSNHASPPSPLSHNIRKLIQKPLNPIIFRSFLSSSTAVNHTYSPPPTSNCTHREFEKDKKGETNPTNPSFANGPPTFSAVPPIAPSALNILPTAPSFEKAGVPVPWAFSPAGAFVFCQIGFERLVGEDGEME